MSGYAIASAIDRLAEKYEKVMKEKNKIERDKLEFEKEKFKQLSQQPKECEHEWIVVDDFMDSYCYCKKCGVRKY